jgi:hypothetical protein
MTTNQKFQAATAGFLGGALLGALVWDAQMRRSRRDLYNPSPWRRLAALGHLAGEPGLDTMRVLTDYMDWEQHAGLKRRAGRLLSRMQIRLD